MPILITSTGLSYPKAQRQFLSVSKNLKDKKILIITTAAEGKSRNKYNILAKKQLISYGVRRVTFFDLEKNRKINLSKTDIVYVSGGNTFKLMKFINNSNFKDSVINFLKKGGLYIGVSAGSIVLGPNIEVASIGKDSDENIVHLKNLTGMNIVPFSISPHFDKKRKSAIDKFSKNVGYKVKPLADEDIIFIKK